MMAAVIKNDRFVVLAEVPELVTPVIDRAHDAIAENKRRSFSTDFIIDWSIIKTFESACLFRDGHSLI